MRSRRTLWGIVAFLVAVGGALVIRNNLPRKKKKDGPEPAASTCLASTWPKTESRIALEPAFDPLRFHRAVGLYQHPVDPDRWYVLEKEGSIWTFERGDEEATLWLDLREWGVRAVNNEAGLLGMAFHPRFADNGRFFVSYVAEGVPNETRILEFHGSLDGTIALGPPRPILLLPQFFKNHFGGDIKFGPDGYLYFSLGDGRTPGDLFENGQDTYSIRGKLLRLDVDGRSPGRNYAIPPDNPFADGKWGAPEVFALGFRNMWRFGFDSLTGDIWGGDVGQHDWEELNRIVKGGNYGWSRKEGLACFKEPEPCDSKEWIDPVAVHSHREAVAIVAGVTYRGLAIPELYGAHVYADHGTGRIWAVREGGKPEVLVSAGPAISSFAEDRDGELYVVGYGEQRYVKGATEGGRIYKIVPSQVEGAGAAPVSLSRTGCVDPHDPKTVAEGLIPYDVNAPLWSDGADKRRWLSLPPGSKIGIGEDGDWDLPPGTVVVKEFALGGKLVETRLLVRHEDGDWGGFSYEWDDEQKDATLVPDGKVKQVGDVTWTIPSGAQCFECHTQAAGRSLGLETRQLNRDFADGAGLRGNQIEHLRELGLFEEDPGRARSLARAASLDGKGSIAEKARAYLHSNCSHCHRPGGTAQAEMDLRADTPLDAMNVCGVDPNQGDLGIPDAKLLAPGDPEHSVIARRMTHAGEFRMPPLATTIVDKDGAGAVTRWIESLTRCK